MYDFKELITEGNTIRIDSAQFSIHPHDNSLWQNQLPIWIS